MPAGMAIFQRILFLSGPIPVFGKLGVVANTGVGVVADVEVGIDVNVGVETGVGVGVGVVGVGVVVATGVTGFVSEHVAVVPLFKPKQDQVQTKEPLTLLALVPA